MALDQLGQRIRCGHLVDRLVSIFLLHVALWQL